MAAPAAAASPPHDGRALYDRWCAHCHGTNGDGRGPAAPALALNLRPPRDFTSDSFRWKSTPASEAPTDADLARVIAEGVPGTSMPSFADLLGAGEIERLVAVVRGFARQPRPPGTPIDLGPAVPDGEEVRRRGATLYDGLGCDDCHGAAGDGRGPVAGGLRNDDGSRAVPTDLTRPWTFRGGAGAADVAMRLATGIDGTPMPSYRESVPPADLWAVAHHVRALARAPSLERAAIERAREPPGATDTLRERGEYIVKSGTCFLCHVQMDVDGAYVGGSFGAGGMRIGISHLGTVFSRNLTPDPATGLGGWSAADLRRALREGRSRDGRVLNPLDMPWTILAALTDRDVEAVHAYLASLPPVRNLVPPPEAPGLMDGLVAKLGAIVTGEQIRGGFFPGNAGRSPTPGEAPVAVTNPRREVAVTLACALVLAAGVALRRRARRSRRAHAALVASMVLATAVPLVYTWPPLRFMPAALVRAAPPYDRLGRMLGLPPLRPPPEPVPIADPELRLLAERGRYVATIGTCPLCHTAGPSITRPFTPFPEMGGGMKVSWRVFGTTYSRNLTPDRTTGLGGWTKREIRRAITSGIARDGRLMHWQAMPWDHFSNLTPEDLEALVGYLEHLPPRHSRVPEPEPPRADDAGADTFSFGYTGEYRP
jgi:mono/diheme cytochrome c family protein